MVFKCSAYGCRSGYSSNAAKDEQNNVSFHAYPLENRELCSKWIRANPRKNFIPNRFSKVCSLHFNESDFVAGFCERYQDRLYRTLGGADVEIKRKRRKLKEGVVPSKFGEASAPQQQPETPTESSSARVCHIETAASDRRIMVNSSNMEPKRIRLDANQSLLRPLQVQNSPQIAAQLSRQVQFPVHPIVNGSASIAQNNGKAYYLSNTLPSIRIRAPTDQRGSQGIPIHSQINPSVLPGNTMTGPHSGHLTASIRQSMQQQQQQQQQSQVSLPSYNLQPPPSIFSNNVVRLPVNLPNLTGSGGPIASTTVPCVQVRIGSRKFKTTTGVCFKDDGVLFTLKDYTYAPVLLNARAILKCKANLNIVGYPVIFLLLETSCMKQIRNIFGITEEEFCHLSPIEILRYITILPTFGPEQKGHSQAAMQGIKKSFDQMLKRFPRSVPVLEEITNEQCIDIMYSSFASDAVGSGPSTAAGGTAVAPARHHGGPDEVPSHVQAAQPQSVLVNNPKVSTSRDETMQQQLLRSTPQGQFEGARTISYPELNSPEAWRRIQKDLLVGGVYNVTAADGKKRYCMWDGSQFTGCLVENTEVRLDCSHVRLGTTLLKCIGQFRVKVEQDKGLFFTVRDARGEVAEMGIQPSDVLEAWVFFFYPGYSTIFLRVSPECSARLSDRARLEAEGEPARRPFDSGSGDPSRSYVVLFIQKLNKDQEEALPQMKFGSVSGSKSNTPIFKTIDCRVAISLLSEILTGSSEAGREFLALNNFKGHSGYERLILSIVDHQPIAVELSAFKSTPSPANKRPAPTEFREEEEEDDDDDIIMTQQELGIKCPYTQQVMKDPVMNKKCRHNYEKEAILEFIAIKKGNAKCPYAGCGNADPLTSDDLESNTTLREYIEMKLKS